MDLSDFYADFETVVRKHGLDQYNEIELIKEARESVKDYKASYICFMGIDMPLEHVYNIARGPKRKMDPRFTYVLCAGYVVSADGDRHFINAPQLANLYGVPLKKCRVLSLGENLKSRGWIDQPDHLYLTPRSDGVYILPKTSL